MSFKIKKGWAIIICIITIFIFLNPSYSDFRDFVGNHYQGYSIKKKYNFLAFSIYTANDGDENKEYFAILKNFIRISPKEPQWSGWDPPKPEEDTIKKADRVFDSEGLPIPHSDTSVMARN